MISLKSGVNPTFKDGVDGVKVYLPASAVNASDQKEFDSNDRYEAEVAIKSPGRRLLNDIATKADFIRTFDRMKSYLDVRPGHTVLELGASHGWASVIVKDDCPEAYVVAADLVPETLQHAAGYERLVRPIDEKWGFSIRDIPFADAQFDRVFTFAAFHHFGDHGDYTHSMAEIARLLKPGGKLVLLYEPTSPASLYKMAHKRVNKKRASDGVDEDVLLTGKLEELGKRHGLKMKADPFPIYQFRSSVPSGVYYMMLSKLGLGRSLVCTTNFVFEKEASR